MSDQAVFDKESIKGFFRYDMACDPETKMIKVESTSTTLLPDPPRIVNFLERAASYTNDSNSSYSEFIYNKYSFTLSPTKGKGDENSFYYVRMSKPQFVNLWVRDYDSRTGLSSERSPVFPY